MPEDTASGATRVAGSLSFKDRYARTSPRCKFAHSAPGLMASAGQLESMGLVAEPEKPAPPIFRLSRTDRIRSNRWPSYQLLECSDAARADYIVTGNQRHFPGFWKQTKVITSREFMDIIAPHLLP